MSDRSKQSKRFDDSPRHTVWRRWLCDVEGCGGEMVASGGGALLSDPPRYTHTCNQCQRRATETTTYPRIVHLSADEPAADAPLFEAGSCREIISASYSNEPMNITARVETPHYLTASVETVDALLFEAGSVTVAELIAKLQTFPLGQRVTLRDPDTGWLLKLKVESFKDNRGETFVAFAGEYGEDES